MGVACGAGLSAESREAGLEHGLPCPELGSTASRELEITPGALRQTLTLVLPAPAGQACGMACPSRAARGWCHRWGQLIFYV